MKKSLIAASVASLAVAAMPVVGVFAAERTTELVDTLSVNIPESCTVTTTASGATTESATDASGDYILVTNPTLEVTMVNGQLLTEIGNTSTGGGTTETDPAEQPTDAGASIAVVCNNSVSDPQTTDYTASDSWKLTAKATGGVTTLVGEEAGSTPIAAGTATSGATSNWAYRVIGGTNESYAAITSSEVEIKKGIGNTTSDFKMRYQVYVSPSQEADTYTGSVTYTLYNPAQ